MDERDELQQKIADIAGRYIQRTAGEIAGLRELIAKVRTGNTAAVKDIEQLAHKIYGSGSMFGFEAVSEQARELELAAEETAGRRQMVERLQRHADALEAAGAGGLTRARRRCNRDESRAASRRSDATSRALPPRAGRHGCTGAAIPGSYWGESEAGLLGNRIYFRPDTPLHSVLHEACHFICMDDARRAQLERDAGGDFDEENAVCYLQIVLATSSRDRTRSGCAATWMRGATRSASAPRSAWFERDARMRAAGAAHRILDENGAVTVGARRSDHPTAARRAARLPEPVGRADRARACCRARTPSARRPARRADPLRARRDAKPTLSASGTPRRSDPARSPPGSCESSLTLRNSCPPTPGTRG